MLDEESSMKQAVLDGLVIFSRRLQITCFFQSNWYVYNRRSFKNCCLKVCTKNTNDMQQMWYRSTAHRVCGIYFPEDGSCVQVIWPLKTGKHTKLKEWRYSKWWYRLEKYLRFMAHYVRLGWVFCQITWTFAKVKTMTFELVDWHMPISIGGPETAGTDLSWAKCTQKRGVAAEIVN